MVGRMVVIEVYIIQVTGHSTRVMVGRIAAIEVYSIQVTGSFYRSYGWQEGCNRSIQHTVNRNTLQELWLAGGL
jgi:hypothetical protein